MEDEPPLSLPFLMGNRSSLLAQLSRSDRTSAMKCNRGDCTLNAERDLALLRMDGWIDGSGVDLTSLL